MAEWRNNLQAGDKVMIVYDYWSRTSQTSFKVLTVTRATKTQITLENGEKYTKSFGRRIDSGDDHYKKPEIQPVDKVLCDKITLEHQIDKLKHEIYESAETMVSLVKKFDGETKMDELTATLNTINKSVELLRQKLTPSEKT
jgi:uncharacterized protein YpuA (DUF1002 family)